MVDLEQAGAADLITQLIPRAESRSLEFKRVSGKMVGKALETICAFANTEGGVLVLGMADLKESQGKDRLYGIGENSEAIDELVRKVRTQFRPEMGALMWYRAPCTLRDGKAGNVVLVQVQRSERVHSIVDDGTWLRLDSGNREMSAQEIAELFYKRGVRSAEGEPVPVPLKLLETEAWRRFAVARGLKSGTFSEQLFKIGLAEEVGGELQPRRAAVLLFAEEPGSLLAAHGTRADIRLFVYDGEAAIPGNTPNLRKPPKTFRGPLIDQIDLAIAAVQDELAQGLTLSRSGFKTRHVYPDRVMKEAIVNAVVHRDYRLGRDILIRVFDNRIEVESPGTFIGTITPANILRQGSKARNLLIASNLREFPNPPNIDAGEGVPMMFSEMAKANLYPPQYRQNTEAAVECVTVTLLNHQRPDVWDQVSNWIDEHGEIANADVCKIASVDTLKASKMLKSWVDDGVLVPVSNRAKRNAAYVKPDVQIDLGLFLS